MDSAHSTKLKAKITGLRLGARLLALRGFRRLACAFCAGALAAFALPPFNLLPLCFVSFAVLALLMDSICAPHSGNDSALSFRRRLGQAALCGWAFGFGYFTFGLWWLGDAMTVDIGAFGWAIPFAVLGLPAYLACWFAFACAAALPFWRLGGVWRLAALAAAFAAAEYGRGIAFTGFPWNAVGYTAMPCPLLMQADALLTLSGMNALAVFLFSLPALACRASPFYRRRAAQCGLVLGLALLAADIGYGAWRLAAPEAQNTGATLRVRLVQPAIAQQEKQDSAARAANFAALLALTRAAPQDGGPPPALIIWPETSVPYLLDYNQEALRQIGAALLPGQSLLAGAVRTEQKPPQEAETGGTSLTARYRFYNSVLLIGADGVIHDYADKAHLVPFGEYLPLERWAERLGLKALAGAAGPYSAAARRNLIILPNGARILPLICYEAIFPALSRSPAGAKADMLVNVTNDAWFGMTPGPYQHLQQARLRAVEQNAPLLRAANTGISAYADSKGRLIKILPLGQKGFLDIDIPLPAR